MRPAGITFTHKMGKFLLGSLVLSACCHWTTANTAAELAFAGEVAVDYSQSRAIIAHCAEENPIVGPCGERVPLPVEAIGGVLLHTAVSAVLPPSWRIAWQAVTVGLEGAAIGINLERGWKP